MVVLLFVEFKLGGLLLDSCLRKYGQIRDPTKIYVKLMANG